MRITEEEKNEVISMYLSGHYYKVEIAEWMGISLSSVRKIIRVYEERRDKQWKKLHSGKTIS